MGDKITELNQDTFDETIQSAEGPVLVDFWAEWCGPCKQVAPILDEIAEEQEALRIAKVNVDDNNELAMRYQVMSIPTMLLFKEGEVAHRLVGAKPKAALMAELGEFL